MAFAIDGFSNQTPRKTAHEFLLARKEAIAGSAESHRNPQALSLTDGNIGTPRARRFKNSQRQGFRRHSDQLGTRADASCLNRTEIFDDAEEIGITHDDAHRLIIEFSCKLI